MANFVLELIEALLRLLFEAATKARAPWFWTATVLWAAPFLYFAYRIWCDGGAPAASLFLLALAVLPLPVRLWTRRTRGSGGQGGGDRGVRARRSKGRGGKVR